ncbi:MAG: hypothetical protein FMNOHCHN_01101 [Ignavibacteriaceae bacterium]|nr:hypothetical protein [Ignavibacteriaceae bacterium]
MKLALISKFILIIILPLVLFFSGCSGASGTGPGGSSDEIEKALVFIGKGEYQPAETALKQALRFAEAEGNELNFVRGNKYLGNVYAAYNLPDEAHRYYDIASSRADAYIQQAQSRNDTSLFRFKVEQANILNNKAILYQSQFEYDKSIFTLEKVLSIDRELGNKEGEYLTLGNLGRAYRDEAAVVLGRETVKGKQQIEKSIELFDQALALRYNGSDLANKARSLELLNNNAAALEAYSLAVSQFRKEGNSQWVSIITGNIGKILIDQAEAESDPVKKRSLYISAKDSLNYCLQGIEAVRGNIGKDAARSTFFDDKIYYYENLMKAQLRLGEKEELFSTIERAKARSLLDLLYTKDFSSSKQYSDEVKDLIKKEKELSNLIAKVQDDPDSSDALKSYSSQYDNVISMLAEKEPEFASLKQVAPASLQRIRELLPETAMMLEYFTGKNFSVVMLITKNDLRVRELNFGSYAIEDTIHSLRESFVQFNTDAGKFKRTVMDREREKGNRNWVGIWQEEWKNTVTSDDWQWRLLNLHGLLIGKEFADILKDAGKVYIVPHGILHHLPFGALITAPQNLDFSKTKHLVRPKFWLEEKSLVFLPSASVLEFIVKKQSDNFSNALIIGNPVYPSPTWAKLPGAEEEAKTISDEFAEKTLLVQQEATETFVKENISKFNVVHFATHGEFDANALESKVLFTATQQDDGYLTAHEIFDLDLNASLVVLSACQSGQVGGYVRDRESAGDDLVGLTRSFLFAGAPRIIATLWFVDDKSTSSVMKKFYENLLRSGQPVHEALRQAQLEVLNSDENIDWVHPFYWAPYFLTGMH